MAGVPVACTFLPIAGSVGSFAAISFYWFLLPAALAAIAGLLLEVPHWRSCRMAARLLTTSGIAAWGAFVLGSPAGGWPDGIAGPVMFFFPFWPLWKAATDLKGSWEAAQAAERTGDAADEG
jgi:hypothetical protein